MRPTPLALVGALALLTACQTTNTPIAVEEASVDLQLPPMEQREAPTIGYKVFIQRGDGSESWYEAVRVDDEVIVWKTSEGCEWSQSRTYARPFAPPVEWKNCGGSPGTSTIAGHSGDPEWPLIVGKKWQYEATGNTGRTWDASQECEVVGTARITTVSGTHDTYKVVCASTWAKYTRYFSPALGQMVRYQRERLAGGATNAENELIRVERPAGS